MITVTLVSSLDLLFCWSEFFRYKISRKSVPGKSWVWCLVRKETRSSYFYADLDLKFWNGFSSLNSSESIFEDIPRNKFSSRSIQLHQLFFHTSNPVMTVKIHTIWMLLGLETSSVSNNFVNSSHSLDVIYWDGVTQRELFLQDKRENPNFRSRLRFEKRMISFWGWGCSGDSKTKKRNEVKPVSFREWKMWNKSLFHNIKAVDHEK